MATASPPPTSLTRSRAPSRAIIRTLKPARTQPRSWSLVTHRRQSTPAWQLAGRPTVNYYIYAANDKASPGIDVYNGSFTPQKLLTGTFTGNFFDPCLPKGFTPYGVHYLENNLIVTYRGPNFVGGAVAEFTSDGCFEKQFDCDTTASGRLQSPWGAAVISEVKAANAVGFGQFAPDVLVGNYSSGQIDAYNFQSGQFDGTLDNTVGVPLTYPRSPDYPFRPRPGGGYEETARSSCSSPQIHSMGIIPRSTARSRPPQPSPRDPFVSRTGFADSSVLRQMARAGESPAVVRTALRRPGDTTRTR